MRNTTQRANHELTQSSEMSCLHLKLRSQEEFIILGSVISTNRNGIGKYRGYIPGLFPDPPSSSVVFFLPRSRLALGASCIETSAPQSH